MPVILNFFRILANLIFSIVNSSSQVLCFIGSFCHNDDTNRSLLLAGVLKECFFNDPINWSPGHKDFIYIYLIPFRLYSKLMII